MGFGRYLLQRLLLVVPTLFGVTLIAFTLTYLLPGNPALVKAMMEMHKKATDYAMSNREAMVEMAMQKLGQQRKSIELAAPNVELTWKIDAEFVKRAKAYAQLMHEKKQIRELPDLDRAITMKFM